MVTKYLFLVVGLFWFCFCSASSPELYFRQERDKKIHNILKKFTTAMCAKGFQPSGIGEGVDHSTCKQNYLKVVFDIETLPDVDFARKLEVETLQEFLCYINSEEGIEEYVAEYPFPLKFVIIAFLSRHPETGLCTVANFEEEIYYDKENPEKPYGKAIEVHRESYEEAMRILDEQRNEEFE